MSKANAPQVAKLLREYAQRTALRGGNPYYRAKAYSRAADSLAALAEPLDRLVEEERLTEIPGVGEAIADIITKLHGTGTHPSLEKLRKELPDGVLEMLTVPGLRPEKVLRLYKDLGIASLADLEAAAKDDRIRKAKGLGAALQTKVLQNLAIAKGGEGRRHMHRAAALLEHAKAALERTRPQLRHVTVAGDFRRGCELVADLALVAEEPGPQKKPATLDSSDLKIYVADRKHFGAALLHATGSPEHLEQLRALAEKNGMRLEPDGLHKGRSVVAAKEADIYRALGLPSSSRNRAKDAAKSSGRRRGNCRSWSPTTTCTASCTVIPMPPTAAGEDGEGDAPARLPVFRGGRPLEVRPLRRRTFGRADRAAASGSQPA